MAPEAILGGWHWPWRPPEAQRAQRGSGELWMAQEGSRHLRRAPEGPRDLSQHQWLDRAPE
eukprot:6095443-Alexandrium_andersonii.AAC.1